MFVIEDELHAEWVGEFTTRADAIAEVHRLALIAWDQTPNLAPCMSWATCGRHYVMIEYDDRFTPWRVVSQEDLLKVDCNGVRCTAK